MRYKNILLAVFSGILLIFIFPSFNFSFLSWIALVPLLLSITNKTLKQSFFLGLFTGFIAYSGILYWISITLVRYGQISTVVSFVILLILVVYLALYIGVFCILYRFFSLRFSCIYFQFIYIASSWVALEFLRTYLLTGFPWALVGSSQWASLRIIQISEFTGIYGVSFLIIMINVVLTQILTCLVNYKSKPNLKILITPVTILVLCWVYGIVIIPNSYKNKDKKLGKISVIQANIEQDIKWDSSKQFNILDRYADLTMRASEEGAQIIVWPETAVPGYLRYQKGLSYKVGHISKINRVWLITGGADFIDDKYYNSAFLVSPEGEIEGQYSKIHLVLFGEKIPLRDTLSKFFKIFEEMGDYTPGEDFTLLKTPFGKFGVVICFESIFPDLFRRIVKNGAQVMVNITEDGWYGRTSAPQQHFSVNVFRAVENRIHIVRAANTGISGFIDPYGKVRKASRIFTEDFLTDDVILRKKQTFYTKYGDIFSYICIGITILFITAGLKKHIGIK